MKKFTDIHKFVFIEFFIWFLIICFTIAGIKIYKHHKVKELTSYQLFMPDVDGLIIGSPVKFMGVQVGYVEKIKILPSEVYLKIVITQKDLKLPKGSIATVEFNGMGGSKSMEIYPPNTQSIASKKIIAVQKPIRLNDSLTLLNDMFDKINSITSRISYFADELGVIDINKGVEINAIQENLNIFDKLMKELRREK